MSNFNQGRSDAEQGTPAAPQGNTSYAAHQNYLKGYNSGKK